jgi:hypothetical protein
MLLQKVKHSCYWFLVEKQFPIIDVICYIIDTWRHSLLVSNYFLLLLVFVL